MRDLSRQAVPEHRVVSGSNDGSALVRLVGPEDGREPEGVRLSLKR